jgi:hypothetical protein
MCLDVSRHMNISLMTSKDIHKVYKAGLRVMRCKQDSLTITEYDPSVGKQGNWVIFAKCESVSEFRKTILDIKDDDDMVIDFIK